MKQKPLFLSALLSTLASAATAELVNVTLELTPTTSTENTLDLTLSIPGIGSGSDSSAVSGSIQARIDIDPLTGTISSLELRSGNITGTPIRFATGGIIGGFDLSSTTIGATVNTPAPPAPVSANQSAAELHEFTFNSGTFSGIVNAPLLDIVTDVSEDLAATPVTGAGNPGDFVTLNSTANSEDSTPTLAVYDLDLSYPIAITQGVDIGLTATFIANGTIRATGQAAIEIPPSPYLIWATANGNSEAPFTGNDFSDQLPNGLLWALGYNAGDSVESLTPVGDGTGTFNLALPAGGSVTDVTVQLALDLSEPNPWSDISTIPAGATELQGPFGGGPDSAFLRLSVAEPSE